ncbi:MAG TPA: ABC-ATPase domain-containing protein [Chloroflexota bacterium]
MERQAGPSRVSRQVLEQRLRAVDGRGYPAYKQLEGVYEFPTFLLFIDHVQGDPFAAPSRLRVRVPQRLAGFPPELYRTPVRRVALEDFIARQFAAAIRRLVKGSRGTGKSGLVAVDAGGQEVLERTAAVVTPDYVEVRFVAGLPAAGRRCLGREAMAMLLQEVPSVVEAALFARALDRSAMERHVAVVEDAEHLRAQLAERGLVAFVADGSVLPRESGVSPRPLRGPQVVPFESPPELRVELEAPNRGVVVGMGVPKGVTLVVGGGYHGKSTLLAALQAGVYNHVPGDGREYVVTVRDAVKVRAEDGRRVAGVDISPFITNLPLGVSTTSFSTENASGSTSQAANIVEALEIGTSLLLMDEDTCATNFMIRDERMQLLVPKEKEPITPFIDQVRNLLDEHGVSTVLVIGGSGDYFDVADTVISMEYYRPRVVTAQAKAIAAADPSKRIKEAGFQFGPVVHRAPDPASLQPYRRARLKAGARGLEEVEFGYERIDLSAVEQLVDVSQTEAIADILVYALREGYVDGRRPLREVLELVERDVDARGLDVISPWRGQHPGEYARPRRQEVAAALNRLRTLQVRQVRP